MCVTDAAFEAVNKLLFFNVINLCSVFNTGCSSGAIGQRAVPLGSTMSS